MDNPSGCRVRARCAASEVFASLEDIVDLLDDEFPGAVVVVIVRDPSQAVESGVSHNATPADAIEVMQGALETIRSASRCCS